MENGARQGTRGPWDGSARAPSVESGPVVAQHCTAYYCVRCTYATYETTSCVSGLVAKSQALVSSLPGLGGGGLGGKEGMGYLPRRGIDRSTRGKDCERGKSTRVSCGNRPITSGHLLLCLLGTYLFPTWQGGVDQTWSWPVGTEGSSAVPHSLPSAYASRFTVQREVRFESCVQTTSVPENEVNYYELTLGQVMYVFRS